MQFGPVAFPAKTSLLFPDIGRCLRLARQRPEHREYIEKAIAEGRIVPDVDGDHVKGILTQQLTKTTFMLYELGWVILHNATEVPFITSDNPSSVFPRRVMTAPLVRFLPLAPDLGVLTVADLTKRREELVVPDLLKPPLGRSSRRQIVRRKEVVMLNRITVMNADQLVFSSTESRPVRRLVRNHRRFGITVDRVQIGGPHVAYTLVVCQKRKA